MPYSGFRYIAYQVPTVARTAIYPAGDPIYRIPAGDPFTAPSAALAPVLQGNVAGLGDDAQRRIERLIGAMLAAQDLMQGTCADSEYILKIFMAPEFYFRPANDDVSYTVDQYRAIKDVLRETIKSYYCFKDWLVIPGTIMWEWNQHTPKRPNLFSYHVFFNSAMYISRADEYIVSALDDEPSKVIEKARASNIDGIPTGLHGGVWPYDLDITKFATNKMWPRYQSDSKREKHIFTTGGITFGLDICLEHLYSNKAGVISDVRLVKHVVSQNFPRKNIQIHLLVAGGMPVTPESVAANRGGYILRTDGYSAKKPSTNCQRITGYTDTAEAKKSQEDLDGEAVLEDIPVEKTVEIDDKHYLYLKNPTGASDIFWNADWRKQQLEIYKFQFVP